MKIISRLLSISIIILTIITIFKGVVNATNNELIKTNTQEYLNDTSLRAYLNTEQTTSNSQQVEYNYEAVIEIDKLNIEQGFLDYDTNNVDKNIALIYPKNLENIENTSLVIGAHSGNSSKSYFHNLDSLEENDLIDIYYQGTKYTYSVVKSYEIDKNKALNIETNSLKLYLTTCSETDESKQLVVVAKLTNSSIY